MEFLASFDSQTLEPIRFYIREMDFLDLFIKGAIVYGAILWISLIIWTTRDAVSRSNSVIFQSFVILLNTFLPILGLFVYLLIRPTKTLLERHYEEVEKQVLAEQDRCPKCFTKANSEFVFCPACAEKLQTSCFHCKKDSLKKFELCPYCGRMKNKKTKKDNDTKKSKGSKSAKKDEKKMTPGEMDKKMSKWYKKM